MKKHIIIALVAVAALCVFSSCRKDELNPESVITLDKIDYTPFDKWLDVNFVKPYNLQFKYRYEEIESDLNYYTVPASYENAIILAHLVKYLCLEAYDEVGGIAFTRSTFPKMIFCIGDWEYKNNGSYILGTAEGGKKILLAGVNNIGKYIYSPTNLTKYYFKTIHHEFTHILNQTKEMPVEYQVLTGDKYVADAWSTDKFDTGYLQRGFISAYSQESYTEDFAEMLSMFVCHSEAQWNAWIEEAGEGASFIQAKLDLVVKYMQDSWGIDLYALRHSVQGRLANVAAGLVDYTDITVE